MPALESEAIDRADYDAEARTLFVRFTHGGHYAYLDVPQDVVDALLAAESKGGYFIHAVRGRFAFVRLDMS